jgi:hypothetical protein
MAPDRKEPTFDADGYPTDETLQVIREWPYADGNALLEYLARVWYYPERAMTDEGDGRVGFATGGWSGNESLIRAAQENRMWWLLHWYSTTRGGWYVFMRRKG